MATLKDIYRRISAVRNISKITQAMRMVSAAKLRRAQESILSARPYFEKLGSTLANLIDAVGEDYSHPLIEKRHEIKSIALIVVATDRGMCGSFNTNIFRFAKNYINDTLKKEYPAAEIYLIPVGKNSCGFFAKEPYKKVREYKQVFQPLEFSTAKSISNLITDNFISGKFDKVLLFYNEFKNLISQVPSVRQILPMEAKSEGEKDKFAIDYIFEPRKDIILDDLLPTNLTIQVWRSLLESNAAEQAARMMAMENATKNANELIKHLELVYNKERQSAITTEMLEIVSGAEALKKA
jgi:F-type H+-transporting ATPase subunit gamma